MSETKPPEAPAKTTDRKPAAPQIGQVVQTSDGRYALVVGAEQVKHVHRDSNDQVTETVVRTHPLVIDLAGVARRHELELLPVE